MDLSLYLHIPFCIHRCAYCDFNTYAGQESLIPAYVDALCREVEFVGQSMPAEDLSSASKIHTIFFGGGTPSLLSVEQFASILKSIRYNFDLVAQPEITIEANPGTVSLAQLEKLRSLGINRLSFGVQSANAEELHLLERAHDFFDVIEAVSWARRAGFESINLDLIYGLPEQALSTWQTSIQRALDLSPEHISAYALTLEHGTPFGRWSARGLLPAPDPDLAAEMYEWASLTFEEAGYRQYEISNWSMPGFECNHNLQYWRSLPYLGVGAGAHGYAGGYRYSNVLRIKTYIERLNGPRVADLPFPMTSATVNHHRQNPQDDISEYMITNLRLTRIGIRAFDFLQRFGRELKDIYPREISELTRQGLLEWAEENFACLRLTPRGRLLGNQVFLRFVK